jgi:hypothetical protein
MTVDIEEAARRSGAYRWVELRLFEALGAWAATVPELEAAALLGAHGSHHAWHAELWQERLPAHAGADVDDLTRPANEAVARFMDAMAQPEPTLERLVGAYRVLAPRLITAYSRHRDAISALVDAPTARILDFVLHDEMQDWREGEALVQSLIATPDDVRRAAEHQARLEAILVEAGGIV